MSLFRSSPTSLDLNGPTLYFSSQPVGVATSTSSSASLTGIATVSFMTVGDVANPATGTGTIDYQWYQVGIGSVIDGDNVTGSATTTLTLSNLATGGGGEFYLEADYVPSAYEAGSTANAYNEPFKSDNATITVAPIITVVDQPVDTTVATGLTASFKTYATASDGTTSDISYQWSQDGVDLTDTTGIVGSASTQLSMFSSAVGVSTLMCQFSHPTAIPAPVFTNVIDFNEIDPRPIIKYESFTENSTSLNSSGSKNLTDGALSFRADSDASNRSITFWPSEKDVEVKITMAGSRGDANSGYRRGAGGLSVFKLTLVKENEYTIKLGVPYSFNLAPQGGRRGGGGLAILYRKANVIAVCGGGGASGTGGRGGDGGGVNLGGETGQGPDGGGGGQQLAEGSMGTVGSYARATITETTDVINFNGLNVEGGLLPKCTVGDYYAQQGFAPCEEVGFTQARTYDGQLIVGSTAIHRGYKAGKGYRENGGNAAANTDKGGGGAGAYGGDAPLVGNTGGGGGGSGYSNGEITLLVSDTLPTGTQVGGNDDTAFISIEATSVASDNEPVIPAGS